MSGEKSILERTTTTYTKQSLFAIRRNSSTSDCDDEYMKMLKMTSAAPRVNSADGWKLKNTIEPTVARMIATDVAKFFAMLSAYLIQTATDSPGRDGACSECFRI